MLMSSRERREMREHVAKVAAMEEQVASLERRNTELRQLVDYMTPIAWYAASERERDRMRELGVDA